jgi:hypothetical protein
MRSILLFASLTFTNAAIAQHCEPYWLSAGTTSYAGMSNGDSYLSVLDDGRGERLFASGWLFAANGWLNRSVVASWDGRGWELLDSGFPVGTDRVYHLTGFDDGSGRVLHALTGQGQDRALMRWTGMTWHAATPHLFTALHLPYMSPHPPFTPAIYGHEYSQIAWDPSRFIIRWTGKEWQRLGGRFNREYRAWVVYDSGFGPQLHLCGPFTQIGGQPINRIARWDGESWQPLGAGLNSIGSPRTMAVFDDGKGPQLYVADVVNAANNPVNRIARWDGVQWSGIPGGINAQQGEIVAVRKLIVFDDGRGPALYVAGMFSVAGGVPARGIARFDGQSWEPLGLGISGIPHDMAVYDDGRGPSLFIAGEITHAGGLPALGIVQWVGCQNQCYADCDNSQGLNIDDFTCFINRFSRRDPYADCTKDGLLNIDDFLCFINRFGEQCR